MANPYQHGSSGLPPDGGYSGFIPRIRSSHASVVSGSTPHPMSSSHPPFNRLSHLLNPAHETTSDLYSTSHSSFRSPNVLDGDRNSMDGGISSLRPRAPQLPSFSRAFEMFMGNSPAGDGFWPSQHQHNGFFTPSYLVGSSYIQKLEEAHKAKQAQKEGQQQGVGGTGLQPGQTASVATKPAAHLGMTWDLIERAPSLEDDDTIAPLPTKWNKDDKRDGLEVMGEGQEVKYTAPKPTGERDYEACAIRADHAIPAQTGIYYFEVSILSRKKDEYVGMLHDDGQAPLMTWASRTTVCIGFAPKSVSLARAPGWETDSYGYHGDDGLVFAGHNVGKHYGPPFTAGDTIGCGINFKTGSAFFTKNGVNLG